MEENTEKRGSPDIREALALSGGEIPEPGTVFSGDETPEPETDLPDSETPEPGIAPSDSETPPACRFPWRGVGIALLALILLGCGAYVTVTLCRNQSEAAHYRELQQLYGTHAGLPYMDPAAPSPALLDYDAALAAGSSVENAGETASAALLRVRNTLRSLQKINPEIRAWIHIEDTGIDYPVLLGTDNEYYLTHAYDGAYLNAGSLFFDFRCDGSLADRQNTVIYGHNMFSGLMFHDLALFRDADFFASHDIVISSEDGIYTYRPFSLYETTSGYNYTQMTFQTDGDFLDFAGQVQGNSLHTTDTVFTADDRILTFSTCTNTGEDGRLVLHAVLISREN